MARVTLILTCCFLDLPVAQGADEKKPEPKQKGYTLEAHDETNRAMIMTRRVVIAKS